MGRGTEEGGQREEEGPPSDFVIHVVRNLSGPVFLNTPHSPIAQHFYPEFHSELQGPPPTFTTASNSRAEVLPFICFSQLIYMKVRGRRKWGDA